VLDDMQIEAVVGHICRGESRPNRPCERVGHVVDDKRDRDRDDDREQGKAGVPHASEREQVAAGAHPGVVVGLGRHGSAFPLRRQPLLFGS
jgi:hypothetical protein